MFRRNAELVPGPPAEGLRFVASTADAIDMGGWREALSHAPDAIDMSAARALMLNHDPNRIVGSLRACAVEDGARLCGGADLMPGSRMESGVTVADAVASGALRGISIGYTYDRADAAFDEKTRTVRVSKWRLLEVSLTPIPADPAASLRSRSLPFDLGKSMPTEATNPPTIDPREASKRIAAHAEACGLRASDYLHLDEPAAMAAIISAAGEKIRAAVPAPAAPVVAATIDYDEADKQVAAVTEALMVRCGVAPAKPGNPYAGRKLRQMSAIYAERIGIRSARDWNDKDQANFFLGYRDQIPSLRRDAANQTTASFTSFVFLDAINKVVAKGFEMAPRGLISASGAKIYGEQTVPDFKTYYLGGMAVGNLVETPENIAFPELTVTEGVYSSSAKMWGGTLSLTTQALINDDTSSFDRALRQAGAIAQKTIDRRLVQKFLRGTATTDASTWTNNTTSGCTPVFTTGDTLAAARANIGKANAALGVKIGLDGNPTANLARFLFAGPTSGLYLGGLLNQAAGQQVSNTGQFELVISPWLEATTITGYSTTSYYAVADPMLVDGLMLTKISGFESIQVQEFDSGAVGARKWKLWLPFEADLFHAANSAGTDIIYGAQQATT
jgi:HK97 family phage prohead protease